MRIRITIRTDSESAADPIYRVALLLVAVLAVGFGAVPVTVLPAPAVPLELVAVPEVAELLEDDIVPV
jgi:hypothetical protein